MDPKEQLLQSLMQDLQNFQLPERYSPEQKEKIMSGRRGQAEIDEGRRAIAENERLYQEALGKRAALQNQIQSVSSDIDTAKAKASQDSWQNQATQYGKSVGIPAAGYLTGHALGSKFGKGFDTDPQQRAQNVKTLADRLRNINRSSPTARPEMAATVQTYDRGKSVRSPMQYAGPAALGAMSLATQAGAEYADDPYLKEGLNLAATAERTGAGGMMLQQLIDTLRGRAQTNKAINPDDIVEIETARRTLKDKTPPAQTQTAQSTANKTAPKPGTKAALYADAKARDLPVTSKMKKAEIENVLAKALKANKGKRAAGSRTLKALGPAGAALAAYDAVTNNAEASDGTVTAGDRLKGAATGAAAGGTVYGMDRLMNAIKGAAPNLVKSIGAGGAMALPTEIANQFDDYTDDELTAGSNKLYNQQARFQEATGLPDWIMGQNVAEAREMAQVPERNPARVYENAYAPSGQPSGYGGDGGGTHVMPDGSVMADNEMQEQPAQAQPEQPPAEDGDFAALSQALEQDPEIADLLREYIRSRIDPAQYQ